MKKRHLIIASGLFVAVVVVVAILVVRGSSDSAAQHKELKRASVSAELLGKRGPRPEARLPNGVQQVEDRSQALVMAQETLTTVEKELSSTTDSAARADLTKKKELIEQAIERLSRNP
jgi:hypothetical protein